MDLQRNPLVPSHDGSSQLPTFWLLTEMVKVRKGEPILQEWKTMSRGIGGQTPQMRPNNPALSLLSC